MTGRIKLNYKYTSDDRSILRPFCKKYYFNYVIKLTPKWITANLITIFSSAAIWLTMVFALLPEHILYSQLIILFIVSLNIYVLGDHLDGMQAVRTQTTSPLGEFMDHYCDAYSGACIVFTCYIIMPNLPTSVMYLVLCLNITTFAATFHKQIETGVMYFGPFGALEGIVVILAFLISHLLGLGFFWNGNVFFGLPGYWLIAFWAILTYSITTYKLIKSLRTIPKSFIFLSFNLILIFSLFSAADDQIVLVGWATISLYGNIYIGDLLRTRLEKEVFFPAEIIVTVLVWLLFIIKLWYGQLPEQYPLLIYSPLCILICITIFKDFHFFNKMKSYWQWFN